MHEHTLQPTKRAESRHGPYMDRYTPLPYIWFGRAQEFLWTLSLILRDMLCPGGQFVSLSLVFLLIILFALLYPRIYLATRIYQYTYKKSNKKVIPAVITILNLTSCDCWFRIYLLRNTINCYTTYNHSTITTVFYMPALLSLSPLSTVIQLLSLHLKTLTS